MLHRLRPTPGLLVARFLTVSILLCAFVAVPLPQFVVLTSAQAVESECPCEKDRETSEEVLVVENSVRRRLKSVGKTHVCRAYDTADNPHKSSSNARQLPATGGHRLANGCRAPLLI